MDLQAIRSVATAAARQAGDILNAKLGRIERIDKKGAIDLVTDADTAAEQCVIETIQHVFPDHAILSEEAGATRGRSKRRWIVDPLDGTTNFAHGLGLFAVSIAFAEDEAVLVGVVLNPFSRELFSAVKGKGALLNGRPITVSTTRSLSDSLLVTGFPYNVRSIMGSAMTRFGRCIEATQGVRRLGSAALDLCYVGCGRFEGFWEQNLSPWDTAAGMLIASEAGAQVTDFSGAPFSPFDKEILATNGHIHKAMTHLLNLQEHDEKPEH